MLVHTQCTCRLGLTPLWGPKTYRRDAASKSRGASALQYALSCCTSRTDVRPDTRADHISMPDQEVRSTAQVRASKVL